MLDCIEYDLSLEEALGELIRTHFPFHGLADFVRIELALELEPHFQQKALINQQAGGHGKGSSKLTIAQRVDTRREVARLAGVCCGNVRKVKNILAHACTALLQAARTEEVSINLADKWSLERQPQQQEHLRLLRIERGIGKKARHIIAAHLARVSPSTRDRQVMKLSDFVGLVNQSATRPSEPSLDLGSIDVKVVDAPGCLVLVTEELIRALTPQQGVLVG